MIISFGAALYQRIAAFGKRSAAASASALATAIALAAAALALCHALASICPHYHKPDSTE